VTQALSNKSCKGGGKESFGLGAAGQQEHIENVKSRGRGWSLMEKVILWGF